MKHFPLYTQLDTMDCGPICLQIISKHYKKFFPLEKLREKAHITKEGVSLLGISEAAESIGFRTLGVMVSFDNLKELTLPCIVHWNQQHFIVVYKIEKKKKREYVYVSDPIGGRFKFTKEEFSCCWISSEYKSSGEGVALLLEPTSAFYEQKNKKNKHKIIRYFFSYLRPYKSLIFQLILGIILGSLIQLSLPFLAQSIVDFGISHENLDFIYLVLIAQLILALSSSSIEFIRGWILLHLGTRVNIALISDFLIKLMHLPMKYFDTKMMGDILQRINDHNRIQNFLTDSTLNTIFSFINITVWGIVLFIYNTKIFSIFFIGSVLHFIWIWIFMKRRAELDKKNFTQQSVNQNNLIQLITGMQEIKLNACEKQKCREWEHIQSVLFKIRIKGLALGQYQNSGAVLINQTKNITITALVAQYVVEKQMTLGMMLAIQYIIGQLNEPINQMIGFLRQTQDARLSLERLNEIHSKDNEEDIDKKQIQKIPQDKDLEIRHATFSYDETSAGNVVIKGLSLFIPYRKQTAIVGASGSGKTTLIKLLLGFYPLQNGGIFLGEKELNRYSIRQWRKKCGVVMQDGFIFSDTIARNIAPGDENIDQELLQRAITIANLKEFIESLPLLHNTKIGSEGHGLSQGQRQRILIARAVYKKPEFVFFDEATNALDANNEHIIMNNLQAFFKGRTSIVVAHRLSTVRNANQIIVLDKGEIKEVGTHQELIDKKGSYYRLVKNQLEL